MAGLQALVNYLDFNRTASVMERRQSNLHWIPLLSHKT